MNARPLYNQLVSCGLTMGTAESCTGGMIACAMTAIPGSSSVFNGAVVAYQNEIKISLLGVPEEIIDTHGAVSRECVEWMLAGARRVLNSDCAVATSGIAGPGGGTKDKPVGLVYIGAATPGMVKVEKHVFPGTRREIRLQAAERAMDLLLESLI